MSFENSTPKDPNFHEFDFDKVMGKKEDEDEKQEFADFPSTDNAGVGMMQFKEAPVIIPGENDPDPDRPTKEGMNAAMNEIIKVTHPRWPNDEDLEDPFFILDIVTLLSSEMLGIQGDKKGWPHMVEYYYDGWVSFVKFMGETIWDGIEFTCDDDSEKDRWDKKKDEHLITFLRRQCNKIIDKLNDQKFII